ncbi:MAG: PAS domain S-box protein [Clostridiales bacterium]|nr:PAS domain S-box protein [Clostridiales bacterium]
MITPEQVKFIIDSTDDSVCIISAMGDLIFANPAAEKLFGMSAAEGKKIWDSIPYIAGNDDLIQVFIDTVATRAPSNEAVTDYVNNDGKVHNLHVRMTSYKEDMDVYLIVITDLTQLITVNKAFARYTSPDIADYVLTTAEGQKTGGLTKDVTIMMSDIRGFTALSSKLPAKELITVLNHYFASVVAVIEKYGGTVIEFLGDGIFVVFGAPKDLPDHASRAVRCAVEMQNVMTDVNEWNMQNGYPDLQMGIGINSGKAVVGNIGSDKKMKYGCMGSTVNIAGRIESLTIGGQILITENTEKQIEDELIISSEDSILPKGSPTELKYYEIKGIGDITCEVFSDRDIIWEDKEEDYSFYILEGKTVGDDEQQGRIVRRSEDGRFAVLASSAALAAKQNLMLRRGDECIYAKVIRSDAQGDLICFTSVTQNIGQKG